MDRAFADAVIQFALWRDPARVCGVIANVTRELEAKGYSAEEIDRRASGRTTGQQPAASLITATRAWP